MLGGAKCRVEAGPPAHTVIPHASGVGQKLKPGQVGHQPVSLDLSYNVLHKEICISGFALMDVPW